MSFVDHLAERRIAEAIARGEFSGLPGEGAPLPADDAALVPEELRMAYRVLRNAGFVPPEVATLREIGDLERQLHQLPECEARSRALRKMQLLRARLEASGRFRHVFSSTSPYYGKLIDRFQDGSNAPSEHAPGFGAGQGGAAATADTDG
ncbi:MAG: DUF1992 domain-containing protein [Burkholderiales bacterium]|jgi:hypothetical protein